MKYSRIIDIAGALISSTLVVVFEKWYSSLNIKPIFSIILAIISAVVVEILFESFFGYLPKKAFFLRKSIYPMAKYEGAWLQIHYRKKIGSNVCFFTEDPEYALCYIRYSYDKEDEYSISGDHYNNQNNDFIRFSSVDSFYNNSTSEFHYFVQGKHESELYNCMGIINFISESDGKGTFYDLGSNLAEIDFQMKKIDKKSLKTLNKCTNIIEKKGILKKMVNDQISNIHT